MHSDSQKNDLFLLAVIEAENGPEDGELKSMPLLSNWMVDHIGGFVFRLYGCVDGHPTISDPYITTSPLLGFDPDKGWARTRSRWYRLAPSRIILGGKSRSEYLANLQTLLSSVRKGLMQIDKNEKKLSNFD